MTDLTTEFEIKDTVGSDDHYQSSVTTAGVDIPAVATTDIEECWIRCPADQPPQTRIQYSFDAGNTWFTIEPGDKRYYEPREGTKQIKVRCSGNNIITASYEISINRGQT